MSDKAFSTMTLHDALIIDENLLDFVTLSTSEQINKFKEMFVARWDIYEIGGETLALTKRFFKNKFDVYKDYYQELINDYDNKINYLDGIIHSETVSYSENRDISDTGNVINTENLENIDLPNKQTQQNYVTSKVNDTKGTSVDTHKDDDKFGNTLISRNGDVNILEQKIKYQNYLRNIYLEFVERFKNCFVLIYD